MKLGLLRNRKLKFPYFNTKARYFIVPIFLLSSCLSFNSHHDCQFLGSAVFIRSNIFHFSFLPFMEFMVNLSQKLDNIQIWTNLSEQLFLFTGFLVVGLEKNLCITQLFKFIMKNHWKANIAYILDLIVTVRWMLY